MCDNDATKLITGGGLSLDTVMGTTTITVCFISECHSLSLCLKKHYYKAAGIVGVRVSFP